MLNNNGWDFIKYSSDVWGNYLNESLDELYNRGKPYSTRKKEQDPAASLIVRLQKLASGKTNDYSAWFRQMSGTDDCANLTDAEWLFLTELIVGILQAAESFERDLFINAILKDEVLDTEEDESLEVVAESIVSVFREKFDIIELTLRLASFIEMDLTKRNITIGEVANKMLSANPGLVVGIKSAFGLTRNPLAVLFNVFLNRKSYRKKKSSLLLLCLVYVRNSYLSLAEAGSIIDASLELLRRHDEEERKVAALSFFEQIYDDFNNQKLYPSSLDPKSLPYQVFKALKEKYSLQSLFGVKEIEQGKHAEVAAYLLETINKKDEMVYEDANNKLWREIERWKKTSDNDAETPRVLLVDFSFPFIQFGDSFVIERRVSSSWDTLWDEVTRQFVEMQIDKYDYENNVENMYRELKDDDRNSFDLILLRNNEQDAQSRYEKYLAEHGLFLFSMLPSDELRKESVKNEIGSLIHRLAFFFSIGAEAITEIKKRVPRPGADRNKEEIRVEEIASDLYTVIDVLDAVSSNIQLKRIRALGVQFQPTLKNVQLRQFINDYYESRANLFDNRLILSVENNMLASTVVKINKDDFCAVMDELLKNALKHAFNEIEGKNRRVIIRTKDVLYNGAVYALVSIGDCGVGCTMSEADYFQIGKTTGSGTGQGGDDIYTTIKSFGGHCHLRNENELEDPWHFMFDILLPEIKDENGEKSFVLYEFDPFDKQ